MPRDLFGSGTTPVAMTRAFSRYTVLGSVALHLVIIAGVLIVPLLADDVFPRPDLGRVQFVNQVFTAPAPPVSEPHVVRASQPDTRAPILPPDTIRDPDPSPPTSMNTTTDPTLDLGPMRTGDVGLLVGQPGPVIPAPPPVVTPPRPKAPLGPQPVGGLIHAPVRTQYIAPVYPSIAQAARVEGVVQIQATIGTDGVVQEARVVSGSPLLSDAALSAVKQWRYTPTTLNTQPVAVIMTVTVTFSLQH